MTATASEDPQVRPSDAPSSTWGTDAASVPLPDDIEVVPVVRRRGPTGKGRRKDRRKVLTLQVLTTVVFIALLAGLAWVGYQSSLRITGGGTAKVTDPNEPGYVAEVKPTPVDMVAVTNTAGELASVLIVTAGADGKGGSISALPFQVVVPAADGTDPQWLSVAFANGGLDGLRQQLGQAMTFGFTSAEQVPATTIEALARLAGPITITNVDNLIKSNKEGLAATDPANETVVYRAGPLTLQPDEIVDFLGFAGADDSPVNQILRQQAVWEALLNGLKGKDLSGIEAGGSAGEGEEPGFASVLPALLSGNVTYEPVPLEQVPVPGMYLSVYRPDPAALPAYVARTVPFPTAASPGQRARVRLLNGTTDKNATLLVAPKVVAAGGEISLLGNAESFEEPATQVQYVVPEAKPAAEAIAAALGVKATEAPATAGSVDVNVIVGGDRTS